MKKILALISVISLLIIWACTDLDHSNPFDPDWGNVTSVQFQNIESKKIDQIYVEWDKDYYNKDGYMFYIDRKVGESGTWQERYKVFGKDRYFFTDSIAGINQWNYYRLRVGYDQNLSAPVEISIENKFNPPAGISLLRKDLKTIQLSWSDNSNGEDGFKIDRYSDGTWHYAYATLPANTEIWTDSTASVNDSLKYSIYGYKGSINSSKTESQFVLNSISAPTNITLESISILSMKINWSDNSEGEQGFKIDKKIGGGAWANIATVAANLVTYTDTSANINQTLQYRVYAYSNGDTSPYAESLSYNNVFPAPSNLFISQLDLTTVKLDWVDNSTGEQGFKIDRKNSNGTWTTDYQTVSSNIITWTDTAASVNDSLAYRIRAYYNTSYSSYTIADIGDITFPPPSNLSMTRLSLTSIRFNWTDNSSGEDGFIIDRMINNGTWTVSYATTAANAVTWTESNIAVNQTVQYRIYGKLGSNYSNYLTSDIIDNTIPAPSGVSYQKIDINSLKVTWTDNSTNETGYIIDRSVNGTWTNSVDTLGTNIKEWTDNGATINASLIYRVKAYYLTSYSGTSQTEIIDNTFPAPTNLSSGVSGMTITLNWTDNSAGETGFKIDRKYQDSVWVENYKSVGSNIVTMNETVADTGKYYYRIKAYFGTTFSTTSDVSVAYPNIVINAPSNVTYEKLTVSSIKVGWSDNSTNEDGFVIDKKIETGSYLPCDTVGVNSISWIDTNAEINKNLQYRVKAYKSTYTSLPAESAIINNALPPPSNLSASANGMTITLNWTDNSNGEDGFKIDRKYQDGTWTENYASVASNIITWNETVVDTGKYLYRLRAHYLTQYSTYTSEANALIDPPPTGFVSIPAGSFSMGSTTGESDEVPVHTVIITRPFYLGKYEVTQQEWLTTMGSNPSYFTGNLSRPVEKVSWYSILVYCNKKSIAESMTPCYTISSSTDPSAWGSVPTSSNATWDAAICDFTAKGYRLPTEAEWEYAARYNDGRMYPWGESSPSSTLCNYNSNVGTTTTVGSYPTGNSNLGLCDMAGNVFEWVWDWKATYPTTTENDPDGPDTAQLYRVLRGGAWDRDFGVIRCTYRADIYPGDDYGNGGGLRLARTK